MNTDTSRSQVKFVVVVAIFALYKLFHDLAKLFEIISWSGNQETSLELRILSLLIILSFILAVMFSRQNMRDAKRIRREPMGLLFLVLMTKFALYGILPKVTLTVHIIMDFALFGAVIFFFAKLKGAFKLSKKEK